MYLELQQRIIDGLGLMRLFFGFHRTLLLSFWCDACSISAKGESNGKGQLAFFFKIPTHSSIWRVERGGGLKFHDNEK